MNYILFDDETRESLKPLTYIRPVCDIRVGILTIREKWEKYLGEKTSTITEDYLSVKYPTEESEAMMLINGSICPTESLVKQVKALKTGQTLMSEENVIIAMYKTKEEFLAEEDNSETIESKEEFIRIVNPWDIFVMNDRAIREDFALITKGRKSAKLSDTNKVLGAENVFVEEGAVVECATLNAKEGPIYIGKDAEIMENSVVRGPFAMCGHAVLKLSAKIYGATTLGPYAKVGGELANVVIFGYSNKAHDGFIGNSVIAEWCNIGADTNASNLKNTYEEVRLWSIEKGTFVPTGQTFCGTIMGDHSKCGINTMFNTGTVVGVSANIYGHGYQRNYLPSFVWGGNSGLKTFEPEKAIEVAERMYERRGMKMSDDDKRILLYVYRSTLKNKKLR
ncbi:MAG TPA: GlmU family protein [Candidatus Onthomorpha intestinigallinarum]|uniref:GlmU family protein n=1 Tax=Candidatus Onthomorpha intestinigallinarum TaxID=2840880 RepID=A0A9D1RFJ6_9BACT|nr:GlmU family protein [Candidatus Onthomorpha intestinigallinarum]